MEVTFDYKKNTPIIIKINTTKRVALQSMKNKFSPIDTAFPVSKPFARLEGKWLIEFRQDKIYLRETKIASENDGITITCEQPDVQTTLSYYDNGTDQTSKTIRINKLEIYPGEVSKISATQSETQVQTTTDQIDINRQLSTLSDENARLNNELSEQKKENNKLSNQVKALQQSLSEHFTTSTKRLLEQENMLESSIRQQIDEIERLTKDTQALEKKIESNTYNINDLESRKIKLNEQIASFESQNKKMEEELSEIEARRDFYELDCDESLKILDDYRTRYEMDEATLGLVEDNVFMKKKSISSAFEDVKKLLEGIEKKIKLVVKFKTEYNRELVSMHSGNGLIQLANEVIHIEPDQQEDDDHGNGGTAQATD